MSTSATTHLSEFISNTRELPSAVSEQAKVHITDTLACIYAGSASAAAASLVRVSARPEGNAPVIVPGLGRWNDPALAAMLIGVCAHADDFDDTSEHSMNGHPSAPIVSALIATACMTGASGADVVRAYTVGVEVACKVGSAVGPAHTRRGWHTMSTLGTLGAAAAAANLRTLDRDQTDRAIAIASSFAGGMLGNTGTMTKSLHCGIAAQAGYLAAALAADGFTAGTDILEAKAGFVAMFTDRSASRLDLSGIGKSWELLDPGLAIKLYPSCSCTHLAIDGAIEIQRRHAIDTKDIKEVTCLVREECTDYLRFPNPRTGIEAKFSLNYTVAVALACGKVTLGDFETSALARDEVAALVQKVRLVVPHDEKDAGAIQLVLSNGKRLAAQRSIPRGAPQNPLGWNDVFGKLKDCIEHAGKKPPAEPEAFFAALRDMDRRSEFIDILGA